MRKECNLHCDVHVAAENKHTLPPFGSLDSFWITRSQRSRFLDKGLWMTLSEAAVYCQGYTQEDEGPGLQDMY